VGKTTTAVTLASGFARQGYQVLLVDLDTQGNVADSLGIPQSDDLRRLLSPDLCQPLDQAVTPSGLERLCVIRSDKSTAGLKQTLAGLTLREYILADALEAADFDLILLDCAPSVDVLHFAALAAADYLLIPTRLDKLAVKGVRDAIPDVTQARQSLPTCRYPAHLLRACHRQESRPANPPCSDLCQVGFTSHTTGYPLPGWPAALGKPYGITNQNRGRCGDTKRSATRKLAVTFK
jgi:cellulose biosynthesis protein BcsQ